MGRCGLMFPKTILRLECRLSKIRSLSTFDRFSSLHSLSNPSIGDFQTQPYLSGALALRPFRMTSESIASSRFPPLYIDRQCKETGGSDTQERRRPFND